MRHTPTKSGSFPDDLYHSVSSVVFTPSLQLMNYCVEMCCIELVIFWLDVEHFRYFDGDNEDMKLFAHHISECQYPSLPSPPSPPSPLSLACAVLKYIGYYAELPIELRRETAAWIVEEMQKTTFSQGVHEAVM